MPNSPARAHSLGNNGMDEWDDAQAAQHSLERFAQLVRETAARHPLI
jgi:hypothetical protein